ncbi:MAG: archease [Candidatus Woesearchaeota archaeon]|nr:MAG: archease [Candidatus Woesearchaeota archaeon]
MTLEPFTFLEHTADAKFIARGKTLEEAFANAARATFAIMTDIALVKQTIAKTIEVKATKLEPLLYDFLEALIYYLDTEGFLLAKVTSLDIIRDNDQFILKANILGDSAESYDVHTAVKSVTYNDMFINQDDQGHYEIQVVHDL